MSPDQVAVLDQVKAREAELVTLTLTLSQLEDRAGRERPVAEAAAAWWAAQGIDAQVHPLSATSANVVATLPESGRGADRAALTLNAHLDTEGGIPEGDEQRRRRLRGAWRDGELLIGKGLVNDKIHAAAQMVAAQALVAARVPLRRSLIVAGVAQETGAPVPDHPPGLGADPLVPPHAGEGGGSRALLAAGHLSDWALVGEPNGFTVSGAQAGVFRARFEVRGQMPYTPFIHRDADPAANPNPYEQAGRLVVALTDWAHAYEQRARLAFWGGTVVPTAQVHGIRSWGHPFTEEHDRCHVFFDVRPPPGADLEALDADLRRLVDRLGIDGDIDIYDTHPGYVAEGAEPLVESVRAAHRLVHGADPAEPTPPQISMWHDTNAYLAAGVPAVSYGIRTLPEPHTIEHRRAVTIPDAIALAQVYALTALDHCA